jgi:hypothetical protein
MANLRVCVAVFILFAVIPGNMKIMLFKYEKNNNQVDVVVAVAALDDDDNAYEK